MNILFFFVHPAKYHLFKHTINHLKDKGHTVDIAIITKDVLEDLIREENWEYTNIFPEGRRNLKLPILVATGINFIKTVYRLYTLTKGKQYDLFITDDCLAVVGRLKHIPAFMFCDGDLTLVPEIGVLYRFATRIIAPECVNLDRFEKKKIPFNGYKGLAHLHPKYFSPNAELIRTFNPDEKQYVILRLVSLTATHDRGQKGLIDSYVQKIIQVLEQHGCKVFINSERKLSQEFEPYRIQIKPVDIAHALYFAEMFISDSPTMAAEAAILGTPSVLYSHFVPRASVIEEKEHKYELMFGFQIGEFDKFYAKIEELLTTPNLKRIWQQKRQHMLNDKIDVNQFLINVIENYTDYI